MIRQYLPRCATCGPLGKPADLETADDITRSHRLDKRYRSHKISLTPINTTIKENTK